MQCDAIKLTGTPEPGDGRRLVPFDELYSLAQTSPSFRAAIDLVERSTGRETAMRRAIRKQCVHDLATLHAAQVQKRAIDLHRQKVDNGILKCG